MSDKIKAFPTVDHASKVSIELAIILQTVGCSVAPNSATYISGPITTGRRFIDWYISDGHIQEKDPDCYRISKLENVQRLNEVELLEVTNTFRKSCTKPVIEPASIFIPNWKQADYYRLWTNVLRRFVARVVVLDGWQYSIGCVIEFHYAIQFGIHIETVDGEQLNEETAHKLILEAVADIENRGASFELLKLMAQKLKSHDLLYGETSD